VQKFLRFTRDFLQQVFQFRCLFSPNHSVKIKDLSGRSKDSVRWFNDFCFAGHRIRQSNKSEKKNVCYAWKSINDDAQQQLNDASSNNVGNKLSDI
jgi:hypothetical protein